MPSDTARGWLTRQRDRVTPRALRIAASVLALIALAMVFAELRRDGQLTVSLSRVSGPDYGAQSLTIPEETALIPVEMRVVRGSHPVIRAVVNGTMPVNMMVDTGTPKTMLSAKLLGRTPSQNGKIRSLCFENAICFQDLPVNFERSNYSQTGPDTYNGVVGVDLLRHFEVTFDYQRGAFSFYPPLRDETVEPLDFVLDRFKPRVGLSFDGHTFEGILLDTGATYTRFTPEMLDRIAPERRDPYREIAFFMGGEEPAEIFYMDRYCVMDVCVDELPVQIGSWPAVGASFFRNFRTTFDFPNEKLYLERYEKRPPPGTAVQSRGIQVDILDPGAVVLIEPGSEAARAGLVAGDRIAAIEGQSVASLGYFGVNERLEREGAISLTLDVGGRTVELR